MTASSLSRITESALSRIVVTQFIATFLASAISLMIDRVAVASALLAGAVCIAPGIYLLLVSLRPVTPGSTGLGLVLRGEVGRLVMMAALFALVFALYEPLNIAVFFATVVLLQLCQIIAPLIEARRLLKHGK